MACSIIQTIRKQLYCLAFNVDQLTLFAVSSRGMTTCGNEWTKTWYECHDCSQAEDFIHFQWKLLLGFSRNIIRHKRRLTCFITVYYRFLLFQLNQALIKSHLSVVFKPIDLFQKCVENVHSLFDLITYASIKNLYTRNGLWVVSQGFVNQNWR